MPALTLGEYELAQPLGLLAILAIIPVAFALRAASARGRAADAAYGGPPEIRAGVSEWRRRARTALAVAAIVLIAIALARPRWGESDIAVERRGIDVAIALDVSRSMSAADAEPTRARAAARGLQDLLRHMRGDRVGLVTFAGSAFERSPLTTDLDALAQLVARSQGEAPLVSPGTDLGGAIEIALNVLSVDSAAKTQVVVLVSDGEDREPQDRGERLEVALSRARDKRVRVYTVLAGTEGGARLTDRAAVGDEVSRANPSALERIARETGGEVRAVDQIAGLAVDFRRMSQSLFEQERDRAPIERFQWFAGVALLLLLAQTALGDGVGRRRSVAAAAPAGAVLPALLALVLAGCAGCAGTALYRVVTQGNAAYGERRFDAALALYQEAAEIARDDPAVLYNLGNALHQLRRFEEAAVTTANALRRVEDPLLRFRLHYSAGAHAFRGGTFEDARAAYVAALRRQPDDLDAKANLELVLRALAPPEPTPPQQQPQQPTQEPSPPPPGAQPGQLQTPAAGGTPSGQPGQPQPGPGHGTPQPGQPAGQPAPGTPQAGQGARSAEELQAAQQALAEAIARLGPDFTVEEARRILELARRANALELLPARGGRAPER